MGRSQAPATLGWHQTGGGVSPPNSEKPQGQRSVGTSSWFLRLARSTRRLRYRTEVTVGAASSSERGARSPPLERPDAPVRGERASTAPPPNTRRHRLKKMGQTCSTTWSVENGVPALSAAQDAEESGTSRSLRSASVKNSHPRAPAPPLITIDFGGPAPPPPPPLVRCQRRSQTMFILDRSSSILGSSAGPQQGRCLRSNRRQ